jgi:hypothetical protein
VVATPSRSLWHDLWLNVKPQRLFLEQGGDAEKKAAHFTFPWLADIAKIQTAGGEPSRCKPILIMCFGQCLAVSALILRVSRRGSAIYVSVNRRN